jgi:hypothetical protein
MRDEQSRVTDREIDEMNRSFKDEQRERAELHNDYD